MTQETRFEAVQSSLTALKAVQDPAVQAEAAKLEKTGEEVPLSFSYALDDAPDYECFVFVASKNAFDLSKMDKISSRKFSIDFLKKGSYLPKDCDSSVFILNKK